MKITNKNYLLSFCTTLIGGVLVHLYLLLNNCISPDALAIGELYIAGNWERSLGRWGIGFVDKLRFGIVNKYLIIIASLVLLALTAVIICKLFDLKSKKCIILVSLLICVSPCVSETFLYTYCSDSYLFSLFMATLTVVLLKSNNRNMKILSILTCIISLSLYQAYISVTLTLILMTFIFDLIQNKNWKNELISLLKELMLVAIAMVAYFAITLIVLKIYNLSFASYKGADSFGIMSILSNLVYTIPDSYRACFSYLFKNDIIYNSYLKRNVFNIILILLTLFNIIMNIKKFKINGLNILFVLISLILLPIAINSIAIIMPNTRINLVTGTALQLIYIFILIINFYLFDTNTKIGKICNVVLIIVLLRIIISFCISDNATYLCREEVYRNYYSTANSIYSLLVNNEDFSSDKKVLISDNIRFVSRFKNYANGMISNDFETWDNIDGIWHNYQFFDRYLGVKLNMCTKEDYYNITEMQEFKDMPSYPSKNCVKTINDIIVVKIDENVYEKNE